MEMSYFLVKCGHILFRNGEKFVKMVPLCLFLSSSDDLKPEVRSAHSCAVMLLLDSSDTWSYFPLPSGFVHVAAKSLLLDWQLSFIADLYS